MTPPPLELFRKLIRFGVRTRPLEEEHANMKRKTWSEMVQDKTRKLLKPKSPDPCLRGAGPGGKTLALVDGGDRAPIIAIIAR